MTRQDEATKFTVNPNQAVGTFQVVVGTQYQCKTVRGEIRWCMITDMVGQDKKREEKAGKDEGKQDKTRQNKTRQGNTRQHFWIVGRS